MKKILVFLTVTLMLSVIVSCDSSEELLPQEEQTTYELRDDPILPYSRAVFLDGVKYYVLGEYPDDILDEIEDHIDILAPFDWTGIWEPVLPVPGVHAGGFKCVEPGNLCKPVCAKKSDGELVIIGFVDIIQ